MKKGINHLENKSVGYALQCVIRMAMAILQTRINYYILR